MAKRLPRHAAVVFGALVEFRETSVHVDELAERIYPDDRPPHYRESIQSSVKVLREMLRPKMMDIARKRWRFWLVDLMPGHFVPGTGFSRHPRPSRRAVVPDRHYAGLSVRAGR